MVCLPCFVIPLLLFLWHKFIQPYVLRFWNPWAVKDAEGNVLKTEFPFTCEGGACPFTRKKDDTKEKTADAGQKGDLNTTSTASTIVSAPDRLKAE